MGPSSSPPVAVAALAEAAFGGSYGVASAATQTYKSTASPLPAPPGGVYSAVGNHSHNRMSACSSGSWTKTVWLHTSGGSILHQTTTTGCPNPSPWATENSTTAGCGTYTAGTWYANCIRTYS